MSEIPNNGITILIDILNNQDFKIIYDFNSPDDDTCKALALFLSLMETGEAYNFFLEKIKSILEEKDEESKKILETIFTYKKMIDSGLDIPVILPRNVFPRRGG